MSHQKIDKLFKERLSSLEQTPSSEAWNKLEGMLANKKKKVLYFRLQIAAAITFLLLSGWVIWSSQRGLTSQDNSSLSEVNYLVDSTSIQKIASNESKEKMNEKLEAVETNDVEKQRSGNKEVIQKPLVVESKQLAEERRPESKSLDTLSLINSSEILLADNTKKDEVLMKQVNETLPPVMIIYKQSPSQAVTQVTESTNEKVTWDAVVAVAKDFKEGNLNLTSRIKEAKEDLFALRFNNKNKDNSK